MNKHKNIEVCGLGNGLVDLQYEVEDKELVSFGLIKGEMRLVSSHEQKELLRKLEGRKHHKCSGGSSANTIIAYSKFEGSSAYKTVLGNDDLGIFFENEFKELNIILIAQKVQHLPTGTCLILISPDSERTMLTNLGATAIFGPEHINEEIIKNSQWIYIEGYKFSQDSSTKAIFYVTELAKKFETKIAITFSDYFITENYRDNLRIVAKNSDLIFCNENEAKSFTETNSVEKAFEVLGSYCHNFCITLGDKGSLLSWEGQKIQIPSYPINPIDSTGAGDMFSAGFLWGIIHTNNPFIAGHLASLSSSRVVSQFGARLQEDHRIIRDSILEKFKG